jgi:hypothetical protein
VRNNPKQSCQNTTLTASKLLKRHKNKGNMLGEGVLSRRVHYLFGGYPKENRPKFAFYVLKYMRGKYLPRLANILPLPEPLPEPLLFTVAT